MNMKALKLMAEDVYTSLPFIVISVMLLVVYSVICVIGWIVFFVNKDFSIWFLLPSIPLWSCLVSFRVKAWYDNSLKRLGAK